MTNTAGGNGNGRARPDDDTLPSELEPAEYDTMVVLERLESLEEEMDELSVRTLDEVRQRIAELHERLDREE